LQQQTPNRGVGPNPKAPDKRDRIDLGPTRAVQKYKESKMFTPNTPDTPDTPNTNPEFKEKFVGYLRDIYAIENQFSRTLERYADRPALFKEFPEFRSRMYKYAEMCKEHCNHIMPRLKFYNVEPSVEAAPSKGTEQPFQFSPYTSPLVNCITTSKPETLISFATTWYAFGQFKIASYRTLTTLAQTFGDQEVVRLAEEHLREGIEAQRWVFEHLPEICLYNLKYDGIPVPQSAWEFARQLEMVGTTISYSTFPATPVTPVAPSTPTK
jgi:ferritin-like metal-binding protein YciE